MRSLAWDRGAAIALIRDRIWRYVVPTLREEDQILVAAALLQLTFEEIATFGRLHFLLSDEVAKLLGSLDLLLRRLAIASQEETEISQHRIRGPIDWAATIPARFATGSPATFVTRPAKRAYQTPENEVLVHALDAVVETSRLLDWTQETSKSGAVVEVRRRVRQANTARQHRALGQVVRVPPTPRTLHRVRSGKRRRDYAGSVNAVQKHEKFVRRLDRHAIRTAVESRALAVANDAVLFELMCFFRVIEALQDLGWSASPLGVMSGATHVTFKGPADARLDLWYQTAPSDLRRNSRYVDVQAAHGIGRGNDLRPDIVGRLRESGRTRWLVGEMKLGTVRSLEDSARASLSDLLAYRRAFDVALTEQEGPYGLGIAWGEGVVPMPNDDVLLATPDSIQPALALWLDA